MTNNNTAQCLAVVLSLAYISGILIQTCGCLLRKAWVTAFCHWVHWDVWEQRVLSCSDLVVLISLGTFLYVTPQWEMRALCHIRLSDSAFCVTCNDYHLTRQPGLWDCVDVRHRMQKEREETQLKVKEGQVFPALLRLDDVLHHRKAGECANSCWTNVKLICLEHNQCEDQIGGNWTYAGLILKESVIICCRTTTEHILT